jgi:hypothetical protein
MPPARSDTILSEAEKKKLKEELAATRERAARQAGKPAATATSSKQAAKPDAATVTGSTQAAGTDRNP